MLTLFSRSSSSRSRSKSPPAAGVVQFITTFGGESSDEGGGVVQGPALPPQMLNKSKSSRSVTMLDIPQHTFLISLFYFFIFYCFFYTRKLRNFLFLTFNFNNDGCYLNLNYFNDFGVFHQHCSMTFVCYA